MSRYINEDEILKRQKDVILFNGAKHRCFDTTELAEVPTADVRENVHGEWKRAIADFSDGSHCFVYECECGMRMFERWNFCPNCGADMRGGTE